MTHLVFQLLTFLFLRAVTAALELADIMRSLGMGINDSRDVMRVTLETMDLGKENILFS